MRGYRAGGEIERETLTTEPVGAIRLAWKRESIVAQGAAIVRRRRIHTFPLRSSTSGKRWIPNEPAREMERVGRLFPNLSLGVENFEVVSGTVDGRKVPLL